jgi:hypothetical protein
LQGENQVEFGVTSDEHLSLVAIPNRIGVGNNLVAAGTSGHGGAGKLLGKPSASKFIG